MEGWLFKKGTAEFTSFGRKTWRKRYCVLDADSHVFSYYEGYDPLKGLPVTKRGALHISNYIVKAVDHHERNYVFVLKDSTDKGKPVYLQADSQTLQDAWIQQFLRASRVETAELVKDRGACLEILGMSRDAQPTIDEVNRAWKKVAHRHHPDRGGDLDQFMSIKEACEQLLSELYDEAMFEKVSFSAKIERGPPATGFGMRVAQVPGSLVLHIEEVMDSMRLHALGPAAEGAILAGDVLVAIEGDDITQWDFSRIEQRLSDQYIAVGEIVNLIFERKVRRDDAPEELFADANEPIEDSNDHSTDIFRSRGKSPPRKRESFGQAPVKETQKHDNADPSVAQGGEDTVAASAGVDTKEKMDLHKKTAGNFNGSVASVDGGNESERLADADAKLSYENAILRAELSAFKKINALERAETLEVMEGEASTLHEQAKMLESHVQQASARMAANAERAFADQGRLPEGLMQQYGRVVVEMCQRLQTAGGAGVRAQDEGHSMFAISSHGPLGTMAVPPELEKYLVKLNLGVQNLPTGTAGRSSSKRDTEEKALCRRSAVLAGAFLDPTLGSARGRAAMSTLRTRLHASDVKPEMMAGMWRLGATDLADMFKRLDETLAVEAAEQRHEASIRAQSLAQMEGRLSVRTGSTLPSAHDDADPAPRSLARTASASTKQVDVSALLDRKLKLAGRRKGV
jgi:hypothetical protein